MNFLAEAGTFGSAADAGNVHNVNIHRNKMLSKTFNLTIIYFT
jgi:hypothetical protein